MQAKLNLCKWTRTNASNFLFQDHKALLSQQEGISREYDRLSDEHSKLQKLLSAGDKKSDWDKIWQQAYICHLIGNFLKLFFSSVEKVQPLV